MRFLLVLLAATLAGCGVCQQVAAHRDAFRNQMNQAPADSAPHIRLGIPNRLIDDWARRAVAGLPDVPVELPGLGELSRYVDRLKIDARSLRVALDRDESARFDLDLDVESGGRALFGLQLAAVAPVTYDPKRGTLRIALRADFFDQITPRLDEGAVDRLADALLRPVPSMLRSSLRTTARTVAREGIAYLTREAYRLLRSRVLTPLGEIAQFEFGMPDVPLQSLALTSQGGYWMLDARLPFSAAGLTTPPAASGDGMSMAISTHALAHLGNWAMSRRDIPARYTREGKVQDDGEFEAGFDWDTGARPLKVHMWTAEIPQTGICLHARAGADPRVKFENGKLQVGFENGSIEDVTGPPLISNAMGLMGISSEAFAFTRTIATRTRLKLGGSTVDVEVTALELSGNQVRIELTTGATPGS